ncbi:hypothetical protein D3C81_1482330 [compost metagenome]
MQDFLRLAVGQLVEAIGLHAEHRRQAVRPVRSAAAGGLAFGTCQHLAHQARIPGLGHQLLLGDRGRRRGLDDGDELVDVRQRDGQAFQHMAALARLAQLEHGAAGHDLAAVREEVLQHLLQVQQARLAVDQRHHVHAEGVLQLGVLI